MTEKPDEIIPDAEIERVHGNANFGSIGKREVVNQALLKAACGYHNGHTAQSIIAEHGLIRETKSRGQGAITERGRRYLWAVFGGKI